MSSVTIDPIVAAAAPQRAEFFRLPPPGKRDPFFGLSRGWYYKAAAAGEIKMIAIRQRGAVRGVRLVAYDSVIAYIERADALLDKQPRPIHNQHLADEAGPVDPGR